MLYIKLCFIQIDALILNSIAQQHCQSDNSSIISNKSNRRAIQQMGAITSVCCDSDPEPNTQPQQNTRAVRREAVQPKKQEQQPLNPIEQPSSESVINQKKIEEFIQNKPKIKKKICFNDFQIDGKLGEGGFGIVYLCQLKENMEKGITEKYAMKRVAKDILIRKKVSQNAKLEKSILATFQCKFIVALIMAFQDAYYVYFVMQCATGGDTYSLIKKNSPKLNDYRSLGQKAIRFIAACVILGLQYLHQNKIMYRDLKPENVLMFENGYVKITDFGLAKKSQDDQVSKTISGTPFYYAPEMILKTGYKMGIDFWTLGVYLFELSVLEPPFSTDQINRHKFKKVCTDAEANRNWKGSNLSPQLKDLINGLLKFNPEERLGFKGWGEVKQHAFFSQFDWESLNQMKMESPIKDLVQKYPVQLKPYKPDAPREVNRNEQNMEGWTYVKEK